MDQHLTLGVGIAMSSPLGPAVVLKLKQESRGAGDLWSTCLVVLSRGFPHELLVRSRLKEGQEDGAKERCPDLLDAAAARLRFACA